MILENYYWFIIIIACAGVWFWVTWRVGEERANFKWISRWIVTKFVKKSWRYNMTETQRWWASIVEKDLEKKGLEIDDDGHVRRKGDGVP